MDDNNQNGPKNQSGPIFESVTFDDVPQTLQPEELPPEMGNPEEAFLNSPPPELTGDLPPLYEENRTKYFIIGGAVLFFLLIFGVVIALFLGNRGGGQQAKEPVTLTYWGLWEDQTVLQPLIDEYQKENPHVKIVYELQTPQLYREKVISRSRNGRGPDIFRYHNTWLPQMSEVAAPVPKDIMSNDEFEKTFYPIHQSDLKVGEDYYGIPLSLEGLVLVYNDNLFKKAGVTGPPTSWVSDLLDAVEKLTVQDRDGNIVTSAIAMGTANNVEHFSEIYGLLLLQNGGTLENLDKKEAVEALQVYREFAEKNIWNETMPNSSVAFSQEKVAMVIVPSWQLLSILNANDQIAVKVAPVPRGLDNQPLSLATYWVEGVSRMSKNQVEAWKFLKFLSSKESQEKLFAEQSKVRPFGTPYSRVDLQDKLIQHPYLGPVLQQADAYKSLPLATRTFDNGMNDQIVAYIENAINDAAQGVSYEEALKKAKNGVTQVMNEFTKPETAPPAQ